MFFENRKEIYIFLLRRQIIMQISKIKKILVLCGWCPLMESDIHCSMD